MAANDTDSDYDYMLFWANNKLTLPTWFAVVSDVVLSQPSSAFMERVFSILRCCFSERQEQAGVRGPHIRNAHVQPCEGRVVLS